MPHVVTPNTGWASSTEQIRVACMERLEAPLTALIHTLCTASHQQWAPRNLMVMVVNQPHPLRLDNIYHKRPSQCLSLVYSPCAMHSPFGHPFIFRNIPAQWSLSRAVKRWRTRFIFARWAAGKEKRNGSKNESINLRAGISDEPNGV